MINDQTLDRKIHQILLSDRTKKDLEHKKSGKLSATQLSQPLLFQMLYVLGVPQKPIEEYVLRKFLRGNHVEDWLINQMEGIVERQKFVEYRNCVGFVDALIDTSKYEHKCGIIPHEVKSVGNFKFNHINKNHEADKQHQIQAGFYAIALKASHYAIDYVASDDYRILTFIYELNGIRKEIDKRIDRFESQMELKKLPIFQAELEWQKKPEYQSYPEWAAITTEYELQVKLEKEFPQAYRKLITSYKKGGI